MAKADQVWQVGRAVSRLFYWPATGFAQFGPWSRGFQGGLRLARFEAMMKLYFLYNDAFALLKESFIASIKDPFELKGIDLKDLELTFNKNLNQIKLNFVLEVVKDNIGDVVVVSDIDVVFFDKVMPVIEQVMGDKDILFQTEHGSSFVRKKNRANIGFMVIRCNEATCKFWEMANYTSMQHSMWDQRAVNMLISEPDPLIKWGLLPDIFWTMNNRNPFPDNVIMFHANRKSGPEAKLNALKEFKSKIDAKRRDLYLNLGNRPVKEHKYEIEL